MQVIIVSFLVVDVRFGYTLVITLCSRWPRNDWLLVSYHWL